MTVKELKDILNGFDEDEKIYVLFKEKCNCFKLGHILNIQRENTDHIERIGIIVNEQD